MREGLIRLIDRFRRSRLERELEEELEFHRQQLVRETGSGDAARRRLGHMTRHREEVRDRWSLPWLEQLEQDVRFAGRGLARSPGFTVTVILTLGLGLGANAAMFGVIDRLMFRPHAYLADHSRVHRVYLQWNERDRNVLASGGIEYTTYLDLRRWTTSFSHFAAFTSTTAAVGTGLASRELDIAAVSGEFFQFFRARPALGRFFGPTEDVTPRGSPVAVLSHAYWTRELGGRTDVLGEVIQVRNIPSTIIGVAPPGFNGVMDDRPPAIYIPITAYAGYAEQQDDATSYYTRYNWGWVSIMARRKADIRLDAASADLSQAFGKSWNAARAIDKELTAAEIARPRAIAGPLKLAAGPDAGLEARTVVWVTGVAIIVLLIAGANVTNLMLARVLHRRREVAVRLALGISRGRLLRSYLTESVILAVLGGIAGLAIAQWGGAVLRQLFVIQGPGLDVLTDRRTLAVSILFALVMGTIIGLGPAVLALRETVMSTIKAGPRLAPHRSRVRTGLLVTQAALSVVLLIGAGLFVRSLEQARTVRLGYDVEPLLMVERVLRGARLDDSTLARVSRSLLETARGIPGVEGAALASSTPFWSTSTTDLFVAGIDSVRRLGHFTRQTASPEFFRVMGTRILRGRPFTDQDRAGAPPVVVVSESMARVLWPGRDALGQCIRIQADTMPCSTVIGIAEDAVQRNFAEEQRFRYYQTLDQSNPARGHTLMVRVTGRSAGMAETIRRALQPVMPGETYVRVRPFEELVDRQRRSWRLGATMFAAFGALALVVAAVGLYGVIAYNVAQRMHELGIRIALGANRTDVVRLVVGQGIRVAILGLVVGGAVALLGARWIQPLLFQLSAHDPATYVSVAVMLLGVALIASLVPAARASRADPNAALRSE